MKPGMSGFEWPSQELGYRKEGLSKLSKCINNNTNNRNENNLSLSDKQSADMEKMKARINSVVLH